MKCNCKTEHLHLKIFCRALFPRGDLMVCIIDDREDVWNYARNLICVQPYVYFKNTGDINDPKAQANASALASRKRKTASSPTLSSPDAGDIGSKSSDPNATAADKTDSVASIVASNSDESNSNEALASSDSAKSTKIDEEAAGAKAEQGDDDDPDRYLVYLEDILKRVHDEYYKIYEARLKSHKHDEEDDEDQRKDTGRLSAFFSFSVCELFI